MGIQTEKLIFFTVSCAGIAVGPIVISIDSQILKLLVKQQHIWKTRVYSRRSGTPLSVRNIRSSLGLGVINPELRGLILDYMCFAVTVIIISNGVLGAERVMHVRRCSSLTGCNWHGHTTLVHDNPVWHVAYFRPYADEMICSMTCYFHSFS